MGVGPAVPHLLISAPPIHLVECEFFHSLVLRLPYSSIMLDDRWFVVGITVVLREEASPVYLRLPLRQKCPAVLSR